MTKIWRFKDYFTDMGLCFDREAFSNILEAMAPQISDKEFMLTSKQYFLIADQNKFIAIIIGIAVIILSIIIIGCTIAILRSQKKTRKMLQQIMDEQKKDDGEVN